MIHLSNTVLNECKSCMFLAIFPIFGTRFRFQFGQMSTLNKWKSQDTFSEVQPALFCSMTSLSNLPDCLELRPAIEGNQVSEDSLEKHSDPSPSSAGLSALGLRDSLRTILQLDIPLGTLKNCSEDIIDLIWGLVGENQKRVKMLNQFTEKNAITLNENKVLKQTISRLNLELNKARNELENVQLECDRKERILASKIEELGRNRAEWEKVALSYKGREKSFFAEIRKREQEVDRMKRSMSIGRNNYIDERLFSPPPLGIGNKSITRLNYG